MDFLYPSRGEGLGCSSAPPPYSMGDLHPVGERAKMLQNFLVSPPLLHSSSLLLLADGFLTLCHLVLRCLSPSLTLCKFCVAAAACGWVGGWVGGWMDVRTCVFSIPRGAGAVGAAYGWVGGWVCRWVGVRSCSRVCVCVWVRFYLGPSG